MTWIGVDGDDTLWQYDPTAFPAVGDPIAPMVLRVREWLAAGVEVRIMTARAAGAEDPNNPHYTADDNKLILDPVREFCREQFGQELVITASKDFEMAELWDDRARQVIPGEGYAIQDLLQLQAEEIEELERALNQVHSDYAKARTRLALLGHPL